MGFTKLFTAWAVGAILSNPIFQVGAQNSSNITSELGSQLSPGAFILLPDSAEFTDATRRWQQYRGPEIQVVVAVTNEHDVQKTILYANRYNMPFLATGAGHGSTGTLGNLNDGIQISTRQLKKIRISADGKTVTIGGGVKVKELIDALWAAGKQTVTGACECVGIGGPLLGGGHGYLQGQYGLVADSLVEARMVLADGKAVTVSQNSHPDLFWGIRGAGHNFGIVTESRHKIYDVVPNSTWAYEAFIFTGDKLEALYTLTNEMMKTQPAYVMHWGVIRRSPTVDPPVIFYWILYNGPASAELKYASPIRALGPVDVQAGEVPYPMLPKITGNANDDPPCQRVGVAMLFAADIKRYNVPALRLLYDAFSGIMQRVPAFNNSIFILEGYSVQGVQAVPAATTAFPHRSQDLLLSLVVFYQPNSSLDAQAEEFGRDARKLLNAGSGSPKKNVYVNYAHGDESLEEVYGHEPWRLQKLRRLKKRYDPKNKFGFYQPIV